MTAESVAKILNEFMVRDDIIIVLIVRSAEAPFEKEAAYSTFSDFEQDVLSIGDHQAIDQVRDALKLRQAGQVVVLFVNDDEKGVLLMFPRRGTTHDS
jgi:hypothetical protein